MTVVTAEDEDLLHMLPHEEEWTVDELAKLPNDGRRWELYDGALVVTPAPFIRHQQASKALFRLLDLACPPELDVFYAPVDFQPSEKRSFQPDLLVVRRVDIRQRGALQKPPVLNVEILSDSTRSLDQVFKRAMYATSGVDHFWIFDPKKVEFFAYERADDKYVEVARARGDERLTLDRPYPVEICPAEIVKG
jgi:Uma2 family endonuclease